MTAFTESVIEDATLDWFAELGYTVAHGPDLAPGEAASERATYGDVVLVDRLRAALARINPHPRQPLDEALRRLLNLGHETPNLIENNRRWHQLLVDGLDVEFRRPDGRSLAIKSGPSTSSRSIAMIGSSSINSPSSRTNAIGGPMS